MFGSTSTESSPSSVGGKRHVPRMRFLARGQIFEASQRMESTDASSLYTNGQGLIKLADGSGWAIIPYKEALVAQFENFRGGSVNVNEIAAFEEIGNAVISAMPWNPLHRLTPPNRLQQNTLERSPKDVVWLRIAPPNGIKVLLPPQPDANKNDVRIATSKEINIRDRPIKPSSSSHDSEVSSTVSSSFFDSMWSKVTPTKQKEKRGTSYDTAPSFERTGKHNHPSSSSLKQITTPVISCGMVVPVEPWESYHSLSQTDTIGRSKVSISAFALF